MTVVLPLAANQRLVGSAVLVGVIENKPVLATALHLLGASADVRLAIPPHQGNLSAVQEYPLESTPALRLEVVATNPFADLAVLYAPEGAATGTLRIPSIVSAPNALSVGAEVVVLGYPFAPLGSFLETWSPGCVTARARRMIAPGLGIDELVLSNTGHPGLSGSAVVGRKDGVLYGILRGALAPPETLRVGDIPIGTDTSVTFATSAHFLRDLLLSAQQSITNGNA